MSLQQVYVTPSTTFVRVNPLQNPYTPVLLNSVVFPGQVVTVLDGTSSFGALTTPIVVSTLTNSFADGTISTLINQPQGFITAQSLTTNKWAFLNSFPFRNQYISAGLQNLNTSTLFTALASTTQEFVSSLVVTNLTVTGDFVQQQGITINTSLSSIGNVEFISSMTVWGLANLSASVSSISSASLFSSLEVYGNLFTNSAISTLSGAVISTSLMVNGPINTSNIMVKSSIVGTTLDVLSTSQTALIIAGNTFVAGNVVTNSSIFAGGSIQTNELTVARDAFFLSSASLNQFVRVNSLLSTGSIVSTSGSVAMNGFVQIGNSLDTNGTIYVQSNVIFRDNLTIRNTLVTSSLTTNILETFGNYSNLDARIAQISSVFVQGDFGGGFITTSTTRVSGQAQIGSNLAIRADLINRGALEVDQNISTLSNLSVANNVSAQGNMSIVRNAFVETSLSTLGAVTSLQSTILTNGQSTLIKGDLTVNGNLICDATLRLTSITLPPSLTAFNFITNNLDVGTSGFFSTSAISILRTSSVTLGNIGSSEFAFDLSGSILLNREIPFSTLVLSTNRYIAADFTSSFLHITNGMGIGVEPLTSSLIVAPNSYFRNQVFAFSTVSTNTTTARYIFGKFVGDASLVTDFSYPSQISANRVSIVNTAQIANLMTLSSIYTSTSFNLGTIESGSTIQIGSFYIYGNANTVEKNIGYNILQTDPTQGLLVLNDVDFYGDTAGLINRQVKINRELNIMVSSYTLIALSSLGVRSLATDISLTTNSLTGNNVIASTVYGFNGVPISETNLYTNFGRTYISQGTISVGSNQFFVGEFDTIDTNQLSVQPSQSTIAFNSTLFVNRNNSSIGFNTAFPNFTVDAENILVTNTTRTNISSVITNQIELTPKLSSFYYATINPLGSLSNVLYSENLTSWSNENNLTYGSNYKFYSYFSPGLSLSNSPTVYFPENRLPSFFLGTQTLFTGASNVYVANIVTAAYIPNSVYYLPVTFYSDPAGSSIDIYQSPDTMRAAATDGFRTVAVGTSDPLSNGSVYKFWVHDQTSFWDVWYRTGSSNLFPAWSRSNGGYGIVYGGINAPVWVAVGAGLNVSAYRSLDGLSWTSVPTAVDELRAVITYQLPYSGSTIFVATGGYNGSGSIRDGLVITSSDLGVTWSNSSPYLFSASGTSLATDGKRIVVSGEDVSGNTLWYADINEANNLTWSVCQGSLFTLRANTVSWTGETWVAAGVNGVRQSYDGANWFNPWFNSTPFTAEFLTIGYTSNAATTIAFASSLQIQQSPDLKIQNLLSVPTISFYSSSILNLNNAAILDPNSNLLIPGPVTNPIPFAATALRQTLYAQTAYISSVLSTNQTVVGGYYLGIQSV